MRPCRAIALATLLLLLAAGTAAAQTHADLPALTREIDTTRHAGLPVTPRELQQTLPPEDQNAAPLYTRIIQRLIKERLTQAETKALWPLYGRALPTAAQLAAGRAVLAKRADVLALIHQATARPKCVFVRDWSQGPALLFPEFASFREMARLLLAESTLLLLDGKPLEAVRDQALGFRLARHAAADPLLISYLVGVAIDGITLIGMDKILYQEGFRADVCDAVRAAIETEAKPLSTAYALRGEIIMQITSIDLLRRQGMSGLEQFAGLTSGNAERHVRSRPMSAAERRQFDRFLDSGGALSLRVTRQVIELIDRPFPESQPQIAAIAADFEKRSKDPAYAFAGIVVPFFGELAATRARALARTDVTRAAAGILAWKANHGSFPTNPTDTILPPPLDPFDQKPLRYRPTDGGFVLYSVGPTGQYGGGDANQKPTGAETVFHYPMPPYWSKR